jgi:tetratricopeptide (TPR) repeat protein
MFADRRRHPHWENVDPYLRFAARYEAAVDGMEHNDFVSQGATGKSEEARRKYEAICQVTLRFLDGHLKGDAEALKLLRDAGPPGLVQVAYKAAIPAPPTSAQIARMYVSEGAENLQALAALVKGSDADLVVGAAAQLFEGGRTREGASLLTWAAPILPDLADLQRALGEALLAMGDKAGSRKAFEKALVLLPSDGTLDAGQKAATRKAVEEGLKALLK